MTFVSIAAGLLVGYLLMVMGRRGRTEPLQGWSYAHRGLHNDACSENSLTAFRRARDHGYGIEFDVHLLKDGSLAILHDSDLRRVTGQAGLLEELTAKDLGSYRLKGTKDTIPTFRQVLECYQGKAPLIIELKVHGNNYAALCRQVCRELEGYSGVFCLESFDPRCVFWLRRHRPELIRGQLTENYFRSTSKLPWVLKWIMTWQMTNFLTMPDFVAYKVQDRKHFSNRLVRSLWHVQGVTWTVQDEKTYENVLKEGWIPIFEGFNP